MRKFMFNGAIWSSLFSGYSILKTFRNGPRDWRLVLTLIAWLATTIVAIGTTLEADRHAKGA